VGPDQAGRPELLQDVAEELDRDVLRRGDLLALDGLSAGNGVLDHRANRVIGPG